MKKWNESQDVKKARFVPVIADSFGNWSQGSVELFDIILKRDPERNELSYPIRKNFLFSKLSISIQRNNARSILTLFQSLDEPNFLYRNDNFAINNSAKSTLIFVTSLSSRSKGKQRISLVEKEQPLATCTI